MFGYAAGISDIRVTWSDGSTLDCLQKIYPVGKFIAAGFAGSVEFGFWAVNDLRRRLVLEDPHSAWIPGWVTFQWYRRARRAFGEAPEHIKRAGAAIMLLGVSPTVDVGIEGFARATVAILESPDFFPRILRHDAVEAIGRGALVDLYAEELRRLSGDREIWQMEVGIPGGYGWGLQHMIQGTIEEHPEATVSPHVHYCLVRRGAITIGKSDYTRFSATGDREEVRMPPVATSWAEFVGMTRAMGANAGDATC
jgi:hypothetical protein